MPISNQMEQVNPKVIENNDDHYRELSYSPKLLFLKQNWTAMALKLLKLNEMPILTGILRLPNAIKSLKLSLCKIQFIN